MIELSKEGNFAWQNGLDTKVEKSRKQMKERKNRAKKIRGIKKVISDLCFFLVSWSRMVLLILNLPYSCAG